MTWAAAPWLELPSPAAARSHPCTRGAQPQPHTHTHTHTPTGATRRYTHPHNDTRTDTGSNRQHHSTTQQHTRKAKHEPHENPDTGIATPVTGGHPNNVLLHDGDTTRANSRPGSLLLPRSPSSLPSPPQLPLQLLLLLCRPATTYVSAPATAIASLCTTARTMAHFCSSSAAWMRASLTSSLSEPASSLSAAAGAFTAVSVALPARLRFDFDFFCGLVKQKTRSCVRVGSVGA